MTEKTTLRQFPDGSPAVVILDALEPTLLRDDGFRVEIYSPVGSYENTSLLGDPRRWFTETVKAKGYLQIPGVERWGAWSSEHPRGFGGRAQRRAMALAYLETCDFTSEQIQRFAQTWTNNAPTGVYGRISG